MKKNLIGVFPVWSMAECVSDRYCARDAGAGRGIFGTGEGAPSSILARPIRLWQACLREFVKLAALRLCSKNAYASAYIGPESKKPSQFQHVIAL